jgi:hypothetical protein
MKPKVVKSGVFLEAYRRLSRHLTGLAESRPELTVYLAGYLLEFRLKVAICDAKDCDRLDVANERINAAQPHGRNYDLLGRHGHDLDLLWQLAGLDDLRKEHHNDLKLALEWDVAWRYQVPAGYRKARKEAAARRFLEAMERLCRAIAAEAK